jgi:hypothetical protein
MNNELEHVRGVVGLSSLARVDNILVQRGILQEKILATGQNGRACERFECEQMKTWVELLLACKYLFTHNTECQGHLR